MPARGAARARRSLHDRPAAAVAAAAGLTSTACGERRKRARATPAPGSARRRPRVLERRATYRLSFGVAGSSAPRRRAAERPAPAAARREHPRGRPADRRRPDARARAGCSCTGCSDLGANVTRSHYPLHPAFARDVRPRGDPLLGAGARLPAAERVLRATPTCAPAPRAPSGSPSSNNLNHPSIFTWSLANEPGREPLRAGRRRPRASSRSSARPRPPRGELDDTRLIAIDRHSRIGEPVTSAALRDLDVLGVNEYFGWYDSVQRRTSSRPRRTRRPSSAPTSTRVHEANPELALVITEYGAEATLRRRRSSRRAPSSSRRSSWLDHLRVHASRPYINGSIVWALRDFRVHPQLVGRRAARVRPAALAQQEPDRGDRTPSSRCTGRCAGAGGARAR